MISIESNIDEVQKALAGTNLSIKTIARKSLVVVAKGTVKALKSAISQTTTKRTGELLKAYGYKATDKSARVYLKYSKNGDKIFPKVFTLNYGKDGTKWQPRGFVQEGMKYAENGNYSSEIDKMVQKELNKYWS